MLHAANDGLGWFVGPPGQRHGGQWAIYAFDPKEKARIGKRSREWTAAGQTEEECIREMARCSREKARAACRGKHGQQFRDSDTHRTLPDPSGTE